MSTVYSEWFVHLTKLYFPEHCINVLHFNTQVSALRDAFSRVEDRSGWIKDAVASAATFEDGQYVQAVIEAVKKSATKREWADVKIWTEEPENPALTAAIRRSTIAAV